MGKSTLWERFVQWYWWNIQASLLNFLLKQRGYDFGEYFLEELDKAFRRFNTDFPESKELNKPFTPKSGAVGGFYCSEECIKNNPDIH